MGIPFADLENFPVSPENSGMVLQAMKDEISRLGKIVADNFDTNKKERYFPYHSFQIIRITNFADLGAGWFSGRIQRPNRATDGTANLDPAVDLKMKKLFEDESTTDDCYVISYEENGLLNGIHRWKADGTVFVIGWYQGMSVHADNPIDDETPDPIGTTPYPVFAGISRPTAMLLPCTLRNPSGDEGSNDPPEAADLDYDMFDMDGNLIQETTLLWTARQVGHVTPATKGIYFSDFNGSYKLVWCDEVIDSGECTP